MLFPPEIPDISDERLQWQSLVSIRDSIPSNWLKWLADPGSLTEILKLKSNGDFQVEVLEESWQQYNSIELTRLFGPVSPTQKFWSRKVILKGCNEPWVMAHTLMPEHSFTGPLQSVRNLDSRPLGEFLFSHPQLRRSALDVTPWGADCWGRRSLFFLFGKPIMVAEFFLGALLKEKLAK